MYVAVDGVSGFLFLIIDFSQFNLFLNFFSQCFLGWGVVSVVFYFYFFTLLNFLKKILYFLGGFGEMSAYTLVNFLYFKAV